MIWAGQERLATMPIDLGSTLHVLRIEAIGDRVALFVDGQLLLETSDTTYQTGGEIGIWSAGVPLSITGFRVYDLTVPTSGG